MPKKGQKPPYRVSIKYPGRDPHTAVEGTEGGAHETGRMVARNGGHAHVTMVQDDDTWKTVARYGDGTTHHVGVRKGGGFVCTCGAEAADVPGMDDHMDYADRCRFCWGMQEVDEKTGDRVDCPVCQGTGDGDDISYWGVTPENYVRRADRLAEKEAK